MRTCSVLIIDDNETDRYLIKRLFKKSKIKSEVFEAENGRVALEFFLNSEENSKLHPNTYTIDYFFGHKYAHNGRL